MDKVIYHQINVTTKNKEIQILKDLQLDNYFILGIELTDAELAEFAHLNIDPQHMWSSKITAIEYSFNKQENIFSFFRISLINVQNAVVIISVQRENTSVVKYIKPVGVWFSPVFSITQGKIIINRIGGQKMFRPRGKGCGCLKKMLRHPPLI